MHQLVNTFILHKLNNMKFLQEQIVSDHRFGALQPGFRIPPLNADTVMYYLQLAHSMRREERLEAQAYFRIAEECKLDEQTQGKQFYLLLTEMIKKYQIRIKEGTCSQEDRKWQQQLVLVLKNSLRRNMDKLCYDNETKFRVIDGLTKHILKAELLSIIKDPSIEDSLYNEVLEVVKLFIDENFPNSWPELTKNYSACKILNCINFIDIPLFLITIEIVISINILLAQYLDSCISHLFEACLSISNYPKIDKAVFTRFLNLYLVIMKELKPRRGKKIYDITNHLVEISSMVDFTDFTKSEFDPEIGWKLKN